MRSFNDARRGGTGPGGRDLPRVRKSSRRKISRSNPDTSEAIFYSKSLSPVRSCQVRNNKLQEGEKHDQAAYFAKAHKGHPRPAKQEEELTGDGIERTFPTTSKRGSFFSVLAVKSCQGSKSSTTRIRTDFVWSACLCVTVSSSRMGC